MKAFPNLAFHKLNQGMDLRDYFAAAALQGMLAELGRNVHSNKVLAKFAYDIANAMMEARNESL